MPVINTIPHILSKDSLWEELCRAACHRSGPFEGSITERDGRWTLDASVAEDAEAMASLFLPLLGPLPAARPLVVGHLAQSMDGYIAREDGESHWISGSEDLEHTHRLRAFCDAVLVGSNTVLEDDCRLTLRRCSGSPPLRVVLDPLGRIPSDRAIFDSAGGRTLRLVGEDAVVESIGGLVDTVPVATTDGIFAARDVLDVLDAQGVRRLFVEGGGVTITHFLASGLLDRLHLAVAPLLLGKGRRGFSSPLASSLEGSPRPQVQVLPMGGDWLFDCAFKADDSQ
jgi:diaminohydroxyphosphoribosylaminopyrimidine deaminase/5-amino-6-(5-phosphoribosylamino)uracil reductase